MKQVLNVLQSLENHKHCNNSSQNNNSWWRPPYNGIGRIWDGVLGSCVGCTCDAPQRINMLTTSPGQRLRLSGIDACLLGLIRPLHAHQAAQAFGHWFDNIVEVLATAIRWVAIAAEVVHARLKLVDALLFLNLCCILWNQITNYDDRDHGDRMLCGSYLDLHFLSVLYFSKIGDGCD